MIKNGALSVILNNCVFSDIFSVTLISVAFFLVLVFLAPIFLVHEYINLSTLLRLYHYSGKYVSSAARRYRSCLR